MFLNPVKYVKVKNNCTVVHIHYFCPVNVLLQFVRLFLRNNKQVVKYFSI